METIWNQHSFTRYFRAMLSLGISSYFHLEAALLVLAGVTSNALLASKEKRLRGEWARVQFILGGLVC